MLETGDIVKINGNDYILGNRLGGGLEGSVFDISDNEKVSGKFVIKVINSRGLSSDAKKERYKHLCWLRDLGKSNNNIKQILTIPKALLDDELGYVMKKANEHFCIKEMLQAPESNDFDEWFTKKFTLKKRYQIIVNMFKALRELHLSGLVFTDLSPNNIMIHRNENQIVFIDTDNLRCRTDHYNGVLGTEGYMAPEIYKQIDVNFCNKYNVDEKILSKCGMISPESDIFSAAVIAFQLLTLQHPFVGDEVEEGEPSLEEAALRMQTEYIFKEGTSNCSTRNLTSPEVFKKLTTPKIRDLFDRTFVKGKDNPLLRPTDEEFIEAFQCALDLIITCTECGYSQIYNDGMSKCVNCNKMISNKVLAKICIFYSDANGDKIDWAKLINSIGDFPKYDVEASNIIKTNGDMPSVLEDVYSFIIEPGHDKFLYGWHFDVDQNRNEQMVKVGFLDNVKLQIVILSDKLENPCTVKYNSEQTDPLTFHVPSSFDYKQSYVILDSQIVGKGKMTYLLFFEEK